MQKSEGYPPNELLDTLGFLTGTAARILYEMTNAQLAPISLNVGIYPVLLLLSSREPLSQKELEKLTQKDKNRIVDAVDSLEALGAVIRKPAPNDRRAHAIEVTAKGKSLLEHAREAVLAAESEFLSALPARDQVHLRRALSALVVKHDSKEWAPSNSASTPDRVANARRASTLKSG